MAPPKSTAEAWKHVKKEGNSLVCQLCGHNFSGSLTRAVDHLLGISNGSGGGVEACTKISNEQKDAVQKDYNKSKVEKGKLDVKRQRIEREIAMSSSNTIHSSSNMGGSSYASAKAGGTKTLNQFWKPIEKQEVDDVVAEFFYACAIPFNVARSPYFKNAFKKAIDFGKGYVTPGSEALRTTLLSKTKDRVTNKLDDIRQSWKHTGCTILSDGWSDLCHRPLINVLVYSPQGVYFLKAVNAMDEVKTSEFIFRILDEAIQEVGEENVVQVITDSASNCVGAGKMIMEKYTKIYWTPCATHCLDLLLHDLAKFPWVNETIRRGKTIANFIINHRLTLSIYRKNATRELLRPCDTRFATFYITLKRVVEEKTSLRAIFCNTEWERSHLSKESKGKNVEQIVLNNSFWENADKVLKMCNPIVNVLRMVDGDKPSIGFIYEGMDRCKEAIATAFDNVEANYQEIWEVIDRRWKMMHSPLHAAGCYLDPRLFGISRHQDDEVMSGLYEAIDKLLPDPSIAYSVRSQLRAYRLQEGVFGTKSAKYDRTKVVGAIWWEFYGSGTLELQNFAIRVLSQGSSASACERNWSSFNHIHSKKRNRLLSGKLEDLVYVRSNLQLALKNVAKDSSNSSTPWLSPVPDAPEDGDDLGIESDRSSASVEFSDDHASSGFTAPTALDDIELFDVTSRPQEHQE
jgi:hypothetical protein